MDASLMSGSWEAVGGNSSAISDVAGRLSANWRPINFESMITVSEYDEGLLKAIKLYPTHGSYDGPVSQLGMPRMAEPEMAQEILARVQKLSEPFGTKITIEDNVGIIQVQDFAVTRN
jgi:poly-gamma-glutamate synthesis protein (capsule biosynthesis protein)